MIVMADLKDTAIDMATASCMIWKYKIRFLYWVVCFKQGCVASVNTIHRIAYVAYESREGVGQARVKEWKRPSW